MPRALTHRSRDRAQDANEARQRRKELEQAERRRARELKAECDKAFAEADLDGSNVLEPEEVKALIVKMDGADGKTDLTEAMYKQIVGFTLGEFPPPVEHKISRELMPSLLSSARAYLNKRGAVEALLAKHDADHSGELSLEELLEALYDLSPAGVSVRAGDVLWLVSRCDQDGNQKLSLDELVPAVNMWSELADCLRCGNESEDQQTTASILAAITASLAEESNTPRSAANEANVTVEDPLEARLKERVHRLDGAVVVKAGKMKSYVRTATMSRLVVENWELKHAASMKKKSSKKLRNDRESARNLASVSAPSERSVASEDHASRNRSRSCIIS